jgi:hypothetical protein
VEPPQDVKDTTLKPHSRVEGFAADTQIKARGGTKGAEAARRLPAYLTENDGMATRERRLAEFNSEGEPPPDLPVQVLCEDQSGTYLLPFACRYIDGQWRNHESGSTVEATVVGWRLHRL